ncbi:hypothetical protein A3Q56_02641 [Intoshia linei]|uniref:FLYWCH-type domain-containing protein n=1 Tax=Intoshia linei TaxID=1819745 RepID=A0A177B814_9BILA|nr:hypothetical protein A3Q56_02641 [Intoshia linei]
MENHAEITILMSQKNKPKLCYLGYYYIIDRKTLSTINWKCNVRRCKGRAVSSIGVLNGDSQKIEVKGEHGHMPSSVEMEMDTAKQVAREAAIQTMDTTRNIVSSSIVGLSGEAQFHLRSNHALSQIIRRKRYKKKLAQVCNTIEDEEREIRKINIKGCLIATHAAKFDEIIASKEKEKLKLSKINKNAINTNPFKRKNAPSSHSFLKKSEKRDDLFEKTEAKIMVSDKNVLNFQDKCEVGITLRHAVLLLNLKLLYTINVINSSLGAIKPFVFDGTSNSSNKFKCFKNPNINDENIIEEPNIKKQKSIKKDLESENIIDEKEIIIFEDSVKLHKFDKNGKGGWEESVSGNLIVKQNHSDENIISSLVVHDPSNGKLRVNAIITKNIDVEIVKKSTIRIGLLNTTEKRLDLYLFITNNDKMCKILYSRLKNCANGATYINDEENDSESDNFVCYFPNSYYSDTSENITDEPNRQTNTPETNNETPKD